MTISLSPDSDDLLLFIKQHILILLLCSRLYSRSTQNNKYFVVSLKNELGKVSMLSLRVCKSAGLQVCRSASLQVCRSASLQVCKSAGLQVCKSASLQSACVAHWVIWFHESELEYTPVPGRGYAPAKIFEGGGGGGAKLVSVHPPSTIHPSTTEKISISLRPGLGLRSPIVERKKQ